MIDKQIAERLWLQLISEQIKSHRENPLRTQEDIAESVGCDEKHFGRVERGEKMPSSLLFARIVIELQIDASALLKTYQERITAYRSKQT